LACRCCPSLDCSDGHSRLKGGGRVTGPRSVEITRTAFGSRRVVIKASIVKLAGKGAAGAAAHLRYLQRDGTTREGERARRDGRSTPSLSPIE
jgi:hypothetical protein